MSRAFLCLHPWEASRGWHHMTVIDTLFLLSAYNNKWRSNRMRRASPLKLEILRLGFVQADVAQAAGMSETRLSRIVNGRSKLREYERKHLAQALGIAREDLPV